MKESQESSSRASGEDPLKAIFDLAPFGIFVGEISGNRPVSVNPAMCRMLGYDEEELLGLKIDALHPPEIVTRIRDSLRESWEGRGMSQWLLPMRRKDGSMIFVNVAVEPITYHGRQCNVGFFHDVTEQKRTIELLRDGERRFRIIADNVADVIWTLEPPPGLNMRSMDVEAMADAVLDAWHFTFVSQSVTRALGYSVEESKRFTLRESIVGEESRAVARQALIAELSRRPSLPVDAFRQHTLEINVRAKDGSPRCCEIVTTYVRDERGVPSQMLGITRDITRRRMAEKALRDSEATLRCLFENLPDHVGVIDRQGVIQFANRSIAGVELQEVQNKNRFDLLAPEHRQPCREAMDRVFDTQEPSYIEAQDIFGRWWSIRMVPLSVERDTENVMVIANDITEKRMADEAVAKEQRLLRWLLDLHERERQLIAYEIHDGFAQQITGALFQLQGFRGVLERNPQRAWEMYETTLRLLSRSIDEARRLISGLRPPILDEAGIVEAVEYLVCECSRPEGPTIEFQHDLPGGRLAPPLESALFRIIQESLHNACRHSRSPHVRVSLVRRDGSVRVEVRDWGIGFDTSAVEEQRFGLRGIRERVRLLDGRVSIESSPGKGACVSVELPLTGDLDGHG
jgi:PAS domain S-box-containing protein